jgi:hypothetical protein
LESGSESSSELTELSSGDIDEADASESNSLTHLNENELSSDHAESGGPPDFVEWETVRNHLLFSLKL